MEKNTSTNEGSSSAGDSSERHERITAQNIIHGHVDEEKTNQYNFMATSGNGEGTRAMNYVGKDGVLKQKVQGGANMMVVNVGEKETAEALDTFKDIAGENILVKITGDELKNTFERKYKPTTTVKEIRSDLIDEEKRYFRIFQNGKELDVNLTLAQAASDGSTRNWEALP